VFSEILSYKRTPRFLARPRSFFHSSLTRRRPVLLRDPAASAPPSRCKKCIRIPIHRHTVASSANSQDPTHAGQRCCNNPDAGHHPRLTTPSLQKAMWNIYTCVPRRPSSHMRCWNMVPLCRRSPHPSILSWRIYDPASVSRDWDGNGVALELT